MKPHIHAGFKDPLDDEPPLPCLHLRACRNERTQDDWCPDCGAIRYAEAIRDEGSTDGWLRPTAQTQLREYAYQLEHERDVNRALRQERDNAKASAADANWVTPHLGIIERALNSYRALHYDTNTVSETYARTRSALEALAALDPCPKCGGPRIVERQIFGEYRKVECDCRNNPPSGPWTEEQKEALGKVADTIGAVLSNDAKPPAGQATWVPKVGQTVRIIAKHSSFRGELVTVIRVAEAADWLVTVRDSKGVEISPPYSPDDLEQPPPAERAGAEPPAWAMAVAEGARDEVAGAEQGEADE